MRVKTCSRTSAKDRAGSRSTHTTRESETSTRENERDSDWGSEWYIRTIARAKTETDSK